MLEKLREFFRSPAGMAVAGVVVLIGLYFAVSAVRGISTSEAEQLSANRAFIDVKTGKPYRYEVKPGTSIPAPAPSGGNTGYPAELCYWTKDGKEKKDPTFVLLNTFKGNKEPTFCPDCGRLVVPHNPRPGPDVKVPPIQEEYKQRGSGNRR